MKAYQIRELGSLQEQVNHLLTERNNKDNDLNEARANAKRLAEVDAQYKVEQNKQEFENQKLRNLL